MELVFTPDNFKLIHNQFINVVYLYSVSNGLFLKIKDERFLNFAKRIVEDKFNEKNEEDKMFADLLVQASNKSGQPTFRNLSQNIHTIILNISGSCNLRCNYCFARQNGKFNFKNMTVEQGVKIIDFVVENNNVNKKFHITFFGGEPMLMFSSMKGIVESIENKYKDIQFNYNITTNGTILSDEIIDFLRLHKFSLMISFDGCDENINNRPYSNGLNSNTDVLNNIKKLKDLRAPIVVRVTIPSNATNILDTLVFLENLQVSFEFSFAYNSVNKEHNLSNYSEHELNSIDKQFDKIIKYYYEKIINDEVFYCETIRAWLTDVYFKILNQIACGAGFSTLTFNADGSIYTCQHFANNLSDSCGNIVSGIDEMILKNGRTPFLQDIEECNTCWVRYLCGGCCFAEKYAYSGNRLKNIPAKCSLEKIKWEKILVLAQIIKEENSRFFEKIQEGINKQLNG